MKEYWPVLVVAVMLISFICGMSYYLATNPDPFPLPPDAQIVETHPYGWYKINMKGKKYLFHHSCGYESIMEVKE